jgi:hypothetical protein
LRPPAPSNDPPTDDETRLALLAEQLTGTPRGLRFETPMGRKAAAMLRKHGLAAVEAEWRRIAAEEGGLPTVRQLVLGTDNVLNRLASAPTAADRKAEIADFAARKNREAEEARKDRG